MGRGHDPAHPPGMDTQPTTVAATRIHGFLEREPVVWLSTVRPDGGPHLVPIWFWWDGEAVLVFSKPGAQKVRNLRAHPSVMLALGDAEDDFDVGMLRGRAELLESPTSDVLPAAHLDKYAAKLGVDRPERRGIRGDLLAGHPDRARGIPAVARPDGATERSPRRGRDRLDRRTAAGRHRTRRGAPLPPSSPVGAAHRRADPTRVCRCATGSGNRWRAACAA